MEKKRIAIGGVSRNLPAGYSADGTMRELIGWNHIDGVLRPSPLPTIEEGAPFLSEHEDLIYIHKYSDYKSYIVYDSESKDVFSPLYYCYSDGSICEYVRIPIQYDVEKPQSIKSIGNILILQYESKIVKCLRTAEAEYGYKYLKIGETGLPLISFRQDFYVNGNREMYSYSSDGITVLPSQILSFGQIIGSSYPHIVANRNFVTQMTEDFTGQANAFRTKAARDNVCTDSYFVRYGLRMYDGTYLYVSPPLLINGKECSLITDSAIYDETTGVNQWISFQGCKVSGEGYKLFFSLSNFNLLFDDIDSGLFTAVDIFLSAPIPTTFDFSRRIDSVVSASLINEGEGRTYYKLGWGSSTEAKVEDIEQYFNFYRVFSIGTEEITKYKEEDYNELEIRDKIEILTQLPLLEYNTMPHTYASNGMYVYNNRLHIYDIKELLFSGYSLPYFSFRRDSLTFNSISVYDAVIVTYLRDSLNEYVIKSLDDTYLYSVDMLSAYISYPDSRAYKMIIAIKDSDDKCYSRTLLLKKHPFVNEAYYFEGFGEECLALVEEQNEITFDEFNSIKDMQSNAIVYRPNVMKVSELDNPLVFPIDKTYTIGTGVITAAAVSTMAISQGQFGQYPLYVFTTDGIYAMSQGSNDVIYQMVSPLSRHICINKDSVCPIDNAVVFASEQGVFVLQGGDITEISKAINEHGLPEYEYINGKLMPINSIIGECGDFILYPTLMDIVYNGKFAYHYRAHELLAFVPDSGVVVSYSLRDGIWKSYNMDLHDTVDDYPELLWIENGTSGKVIERVKADGGCAYENNLLMVTNPFSLSDYTSLSSVKRIRILSVLSGNITIYLLSSNDGISWTTVWNKTIVCDRLINPVIALPNGSYRFFSLIISGSEIEKRSFIAGFEIEYSDRFEDK